MVFLPSGLNRHIHQLVNGKTLQGAFPSANDFPATADHVIHLVINTVLVVMEKPQLPDTRVQRKIHGLLDSGMSPAPNFRILFIPILGVMNQQISV